jgi:Multicopper oxidase
MTDTSSDRMSGCLLSLSVLGKQIKVLAIEQDSGVQGFEAQTSSGFNVEVMNQLKEPTSIHWHGLVLPALMDGVPFVSQEPIPPNGKFHYQFPLKQSGTYWMHSHFGPVYPLKSKRTHTDSSSIGAQPENREDRPDPHRRLSCPFSGRASTYLSSLPKTKSRL